MENGPWDKLPTALLKLCWKLVCFINSLSYYIKSFLVLGYVEEAVNSLKEQLKGENTIFEYKIEVDAVNLTVR